MRGLDRIAASDEFRRRIESARGTTDILVRRRGSVEDARGGADPDAIATVDGCLDEISEAVGLPVEDASVFSDGGRTTATLTFAIPGSRAKLAILYEGGRGDIPMELLLAERVAVQHPSLVDLAHANVEPEILVDLHFREVEADAVKAFLRRIGCRPKPPGGPTMSYETTRLEIEPIRSEEHDL